MKRNGFLSVFILLALLLTWSCGPKPGLAPAGAPDEAAERLFRNAEELYAKQEYDKARAQYAEYLTRYPDTSLTAAALMKTGNIHMVQGRFVEARAVYEKILNEYYDSAFAQDAMVEILISYYREGSFPAVIDRAAEFLNVMTSTGHIFRTYAIVGDAYLAMDRPMDAVEFYARARYMADETEQAGIEAKLREAITALNSEEVAELMDRSDADLPMDVILFQLGLDYAMEENYRESLKILDEFIRRYPEHENAELARSLVAEINQNALYNRYTIGCLLPLSGPYQSVGEKALRGVELALNHYLASHPQTPVQIVVKDTASDADQTIRAIEELYREKVAAIVGPVVHVESAALEAQNMGIPIITISQKDGIPQIGDQVFRNFMTPRMQVEALAAVAVQKIGAYRFALLYPEENYGRAFMNLFWDELLKYGAEVVGVEGYDPAAADFSDPIKKLVGLYYPIPEDLKPEPPEAVESDTAPEESDQSRSGGRGDRQDPEEPEAIVDFDAIFIPDGPTKIGQIVPQLLFFDIKNVYLIGTNLWHSEELIDIAGQYVQGAIMPDGFYSESPDQQVREFVETYTSIYQQNPGFIEAVLYDSVSMLFDVITRPEVQFRSDIKHELTSVNDYRGVTGLRGFDENGEARQKLYLLRITGRRFEELQ